MAFRATILSLKNQNKRHRKYTGWLKNMYPVYSKVCNDRNKVFS